MNAQIRYVHHGRAELCGWMAEWNNRHGEWWADLSRDESASPVLLAEQWRQAFADEHPYAPEGYAPDVVILGSRSGQPILEYTSEGGWIVL